MLHPVAQQSPFMVDLHEQVGRTTLNPPPPQLLSSSLRSKADSLLHVSPVMGGGGDDTRSQRGRVFPGMPIIKDSLGHEFCPTGLLFSVF